LSGPHAQSIGGGRTTGSSDGEAAMYTVIDLVSELLVDASTIRDP
jgi:hypothetical protein